MVRSILLAAMFTALPSLAQAQSQILPLPSMLVSSFERSWSFVKTNFQEPEKACLALAIYHEARGETVEGQRAVAKVIMNRKLSKAYPNTICGVVYQNIKLENRCQFSFACDGRTDVPYNTLAWKTSQGLADDYMSSANGSTFADVQLPETVVIPQRSIRYGSSYALEKATHYHADYVKPNWATGLIPAGKIGRHVFYVSERVLTKG